MSDDEDSSTSTLVHSGDQSNIAHDQDKNSPASPQHSTSPSMSVSVTDSEVMSPVAAQKELPVNNQIEDDELGLHEEDNEEAGDGEEEIEGEEMEGEIEGEEIEEEEEDEEEEEEEKVRPTEPGIQPGSGKTLSSALEAVATAAVAAFQGAPRNPPEQEPSQTSEPEEKIEERDEAGKNDDEDTVSEADDDDDRKLTNAPSNLDLSDQLMELAWWIAKFSPEAFDMASPNSNYEGVDWWGAVLQSASPRLRHLMEEKLPTNSDHELNLSHLISPPLVPRFDGFLKKMRRAVASESIPKPIKVLLGISEARGAAQSPQPADSGTATTPATDIVVHHGIGQPDTLTDEGLKELASLYAQSKLQSKKLGSRQIWNWDFMIPRASQPMVGYIKQIRERYHHFYAKPIKYLVRPHQKDVFREFCNSFEQQLDGDRLILMDDELKELAYLYVKAKKSWNFHSILQEASPDLKRLMKLTAKQINADMCPLSALIREWQVDDFHRYCSFTEPSSLPNNSENTPQSKKSASEHDTSRSSALAESDLEELANLYVESSQRNSKQRWDWSYILSKASPSLCSIIEQAMQKASFSSSPLGCLIKNGEQRAKFHKYTGFSGKTAARKNFQELQGNVDLSVGLTDAEVELAWVRQESRFAKKGSRGTVRWDFILNHATGDLKAIIDKEKVKPRWHGGNRVHKLVRRSALEHFDSKSKEIFDKLVGGYRREHMRAFMEDCGDEQAKTGSAKNSQRPTMSFQPRPSSPVAQDPLKQIHKIGDCVFASTNGVLDDHNGWSKGQVIGIIDKDDDSRQSRKYKILFEDTGSKLDVDDLFVRTNIEYTWLKECKIDDLKGVMINREPESEDPYLRLRGWYLTELTGSQGYASVHDAMRAYDDEVVTRKRESTVAADLNLAEEWNFESGIPVRKVKITTQNSMEDEIDRISTAGGASSLRQDGISSAAKRKRDQEAGSDLFRKPAARPRIEEGARNHGSPLFQPTTTTPNKNSNTRIAYRGQNLLPSPQIAAYQGAAKALVSPPIQTGHMQLARGQAAAIQQVPGLTAGQIAAQYAMARGPDYNTGTTNTTTASVLPQARQHPLVKTHKEYANVLRWFVRRNEQRWTDFERSLQKEWSQITDLTVAQRMVEWDQFQWHSQRGWKEFGGEELSALERNCHECAELVARIMAHLPSSVSGEHRTFVDRFALFRKERMEDFVRRFQNDASKFYTGPQQAQLDGWTAFLVRQRGRWTVFWLSEHLLVEHHIQELQNCITVRG